MLKIVGFGEVVRLEPGFPTKKELRVLDTSGVEHGVIVPPEVVQQLMSIWAGVPTSKSLIPQRQADVPRADGGPCIDVGDVSHADQRHPVPAGIATEVDFSEMRHTSPKPKFLEDDDGQQI